MKTIIISIFCFFSFTSILHAQTDTLAVEFKATVSFTDTIHDFGTITFGEDAIYSFEFTNTSEVPLEITEVKSTCGCTIPEAPTTAIAPGATSKITVKYNTRRSGIFEKGVTVYSNAGEPILLKIKGEVTQNPNKPVLGQ